MEKIVQYSGKWEDWWKAFKWCFGNGGEVALVLFPTAVPVTANQMCLLSNGRGDNKRDYRRKWT